MMDQYQMWDRMTYPLKVCFEKENGDEVRVEDVCPRWSNPNAFGNRKKICHLDGCGDLLDDHFRHSLMIPLILLGVAVFILFVLGSIFILQITYNFRKNYSCEDEPLKVLCVAIRFLRGRFRNYIFNNFRKIIIAGAVYKEAILFCRPSLNFFCVARPVFRSKIFRPSSFPLKTTKNCRPSYKSPKFIARP